MTSDLSHHSRQATSVFGKASKVGRGASLATRVGRVGASLLLATPIILAQQLAPAYAGNDSSASKSIESIIGAFEKGMKPSHAWPRIKNNYFSDGRAFDFDKLKSAGYRIRPDLSRDFRKSKRVRGIVAQIIQAAERHGINPVLLCNQLYQESVHFNKDVISGKRNSPMGAVGIAQFMPKTAKSLYGASVEDLKDVSKAIDLAARHMSALQTEHNGDIVLAMVQYNGGKGAIDYVAGEIGRPISGKEWTEFMKNKKEERRGEVAYNNSAWYNETLKYVGITTGASWDGIHYILADVSFSGIKSQPFINRKKNEPVPH